MQTAIHSVTAASEVIQLAIAPVFLLMGISSLLAVLTGRLGRVVDRFRLLNEQGDPIKLTTKYQQELIILESRANWVHWSIALCTITLLLISMVIGLLFLGSEVQWDSSWLVSQLFILAMLSLITGLGCFLREIHLSKHTFSLSSKQ